MDNGKKYVYFAVALTVAGAVCLGLSFTGAGLYALIACEFLQISAITLVNLQKRVNDFGWLIYIKIAAYLLFFAGLALLIGGAVRSAVK